jgi:hypothetical protein
MTRWIKRLSIISVLLGLLTSHLLAVIDFDYQRKIYHALASVLPATWTRNSPVHRQQVKIAKAKKLREKIAKRNIRNISVNLSSIGAEAIPMIGLATIVGVTFMDIRDACKDAQDLDRILMLMDAAEIEGSENSRKICGFRIPDKYADKIPGEFLDRSNSDD